MQYVCVVVYAGCNITPDSDGYVDIPSSWTTIGSGAFYQCTSLASVTIPDSVTTIGDAAFLGCTSLASVTIGDSVTTIGDYAFAYSTSLSSVTIYSNSHVSIGDDGFQGCSNLQNVTVHTSNNITFGSGALNDSTKLEYIVFKNSITSIIGLPLFLEDQYQCIQGEQCKCQNGYGNNLGTNISEYFNCLPCSPGFSSIGTQSACIPCRGGTYANNSAQTLCTPCDSGTYRISVGANICTPCHAGTYHSVAGAVECVTVSDDTNFGLYSADKVTLHECPKDSIILLRGVDGDVEEAAGSSTQSCEACESAFGASECSLGDVVEFTTYAGARKSFHRCKFSCELFSLHVSDTLVVIIATGMVLLFLTGFAFIERQLEHEEPQALAEDKTWFCLPYIWAIAYPADPFAKNKKVVRNLSKRRSFNWTLATGMFLFVVIPAADTITDLAYIISSNFYNVGFFVGSIATFSIPNLAFIGLLHRRGVLMRMNRFRVPKALRFEAHDDIVKVAVTSVIIVVRLLLTIAFIPFAVVLGMLLYSTKVFAIKGVYNLWVWLWTGDEENCIEEAIDVEVLNESIYVEILGETFPQVILQVSNNYLINPAFNSWGPVTLASLLVTILNTVNGIWKIVYYKLIWGIKLVDIPVSFAGRNLNSVHPHKKVGGADLGSRRLGQEELRGASSTARVHDLETELARMTDRARASHSLADRVRALERELGVVKEQRDRAVAASELL